MTTEPVGHKWDMEWKAIKMQENVVQNAEVTRPRKHYFDLMRVIAAICVILLHVSAGGLQADVQSSEWAISNFFCSSVRWVVPVFIMISGSLFLSSEKPFERIVRENVKHMALIYLFWSTTYAVMDSVQSLMCGQSFSVLALIKEIVVGHFHLWFFYLVIGMYLLIPFMRMIVGNKALFKYYLCLAFVFHICLPQAISLISLANAGYGETLGSIVDRMNMFMVTGYPFYFMLGYYLDTTNRVSPSLSVALLLVGFGVTCVGTAAISAWKGETLQTIYNSTNINVLLESVGVFCGVKYLGKWLERTGAPLKPLRVLSDLSLGVFVLHPIAMRVCGRFGLNALAFNPVLAIPLTTILCALLSFGVAYVLRLIPPIKRYFL
ncbi:MAG: acyltransferase family protein [Atopobiaceae bacterium]|nr:acyltransferase family protein [Atopobiaceae bacterium]